MQNPYTRCAFEVTTFLTRRSKVSQIGVNLTSLLSAPIDFVMAPSRKILGMLGKPRDGEDAAKPIHRSTHSESAVGSKGLGGLLSGMGVSKRGTLGSLFGSGTAARSPASGAMSPVDLPAESSSRAPSISSPAHNPFKGVNAVAGGDTSSICTLFGCGHVELLRIRMRAVVFAFAAVFAGASAQAGGAKIPSARAGDLLNKDELELAETRMYAPVTGMHVRC